MIRNIVYIFAVIIACVALLTVDIDISNWQYWVVLGCLCAANVSGYFYGAHDKDAE